MVDTISQNEGRFYNIDQNDAILDSILQNEGIFNIIGLFYSINQNDANVIV